MNRDQCRTTREAIDGLRSLEELAGFRWVVRNVPGAKVMTDDDWAALAHKKIEFEREAKK